MVVLSVQPVGRVNTYFEQWLITQVNNCHAYTARVLTYAIECLDRCEGLLADRCVCSPFRILVGDVACFDVLNVRAVDRSGVDHLLVTLFLNLHTEVHVSIVALIILHGACSRARSLEHAESETKSELRAVCRQAATFTIQVQVAQRCRYT